MSTIYILWLRQIKRYFRSKSRIVGSLGQPVLFLVALGYGFGSIFQKAGAGNYIQFLTPGIIAMTVMFTAVFSGMEIIWDRQFGFLKETLVAPVSRTKIIIGRTLGGAAVSLFQGIAVIILAYLFGFRVIAPNIGNVILTLLFIILIALFFAGLGTAIASFLEDMQGFQLIMNFLVQPIFFLSGALFPLSGLPGGLEFITRINPLAYGVDGLRGALLDLTHFGYFNDIITLGGLTVIVLGIGSYLFSKIEI